MLAFQTIPFVLIGEGLSFSAISFVLAGGASPSRDHFFDKQTPCGSQTWPPPPLLASPRFLFQLFRDVLEVRKEFQVTRF